MAVYPGAAAADSDLHVAVNNLSTLLNGSLTSSGDNTSGSGIAVASTTGFPTEGYITIDAEAIHYTGITGNNFTGITRGADGTVGASHVNNSNVYHNVIAAHHNANKGEIEAVETDLVNCFAALTQSQSPASTATTIFQRLSQIITQIKTLLGTTNWYDAVAVSLVNKLSLAGGTLTGTLIANGGIRFQSGGPTTLADNVNVASVTSLQNNSGTITINGFAGGTTGQVVLVQNLNSTLGQNITFVNNSGSGTQKFNFPNGANVVVGALGGAAFIFDGTNWELLATFRDIGTQGTTTNDNANTGDVGEYVAASWSAVALAASGAFKNMQSISLGPGDWDIVGYGTFGQGGGGTTGPNNLYIGTSNTQADAVAGVNLGYGAAPNGAYSTGIGSIVVRLSLSATTTVFAAVASVYSGAASTSFGVIRARRVR